MWDRCYPRAERELTLVTARTRSERRDTPNEGDELWEKGSDHGKTIDPDSTVLKRRFFEKSWWFNSRQWTSVVVQNKKSGGKNETCYRKQTSGRTEGADRRDEVVSSLVQTERETSWVTDMVTDYGSSASHQ